MRILFVLSGLSIGGLEVFTISLAERLVEKGKKVGILVFKSSGSGFDLIRDNKIDIFKAHRKGKFNFLFLLNVYKAIKTFKPDLVLSLSDFIYFFVEPIKKLLRLSAPHLIGFHIWLPFSLKNRLLSRLFMFFSKLWKAYYIFMSNIQSRQYQQHYRLPEKRSFVIYNGVDTNFFSPPGNKKNVFFTIIHIANIIPRKDQWTLLRSLDLLNRELKKWRLIFIGEDRLGLLDGFKAYLSNKDILDKVDFIQNADRKAVKKFLCESDVFILTSILEILPIAALEAMAAGLPCILTNVEGCPEIVKDGYNGYLVEPRNEKASADRLLYLYRNPDLLRQMARNARETAVEKFNLDKCAEMYINTFGAVKNDLKY